MLFYCKLCNEEIILINNLCFHCLKIQEYIKKYGKEFILDRLNKNKKKLDVLKGNKLIIKDSANNNNKTP
tara:strand:- start:283 stop:492 length:210 start_codon:yes stop_codon:yes gene_type:complete